MSVVDGEGWIVVNSNPLESKKRKKDRRSRNPGRISFGSDSKTDSLLNGFLPFLQFDLGGSITMSISNSG